MSDKTKAAMEALISNPMPCINCGGESDLLGFYFPKDQSIYHPPKDHTASVAYYLCKKCVEIKDIAARVETIIEVQYRSQSN